jgi:hypothetical protein
MFNYTHVPFIVNMLFSGLLKSLEQLFGHRLRKNVLVRVTYENSHAISVPGMLILLQLPT